MQDRQHQILIRQRFAQIAAGSITEEKTVVDVCPGGGKSRNVQIAVEELNNRQMAGGLIWLVPRASLAAQSRRSFNKQGGPFRLGTVGLQLRKQWGYVATYQKFISMRADMYAKGVAERLQGRPGVVLLVLDELHHCSSDLEQAWSAGVDKLRRTLLSYGVKLHVMNMTGTLYRGDGQPILYVDYKDGHAVSHIHYGLTAGRAEQAVVPPELIYMDGPVVIRSKAGNEKGYTSMTEVPETHRAKVRKAFVSGSIGMHNHHDELKDPRQFTALFLLRYGIEHYLQKRKEYDHPMQSIVVASSAATAMGYTSWLRRNYPHLRVGVSLADERASKFGAIGFRRVDFRAMTLVTNDGTEISVHDFINVNGAVSENTSTWVEDMQLMGYGMPRHNFGTQMSAYKATLSRSGQEEFEALPISEQIIHGFQAAPINGENVIDVLVTVGKAYEGLDAPRVKHLVCLTRQRSAPWLAQCFARAWRRDYELQSKGITDQRCWIFAPRDQEMLDAVDRIVWDKDLAPTRSVGDEQDDPKPIDAVLNGDQFESYEDFLRAMEEEIDEDAAADAIDDEVWFGDGEWSGDDEKKDEKPKQPVKAFSIVDRIIHTFVSDARHEMVVMTDKKVTAEEMLAR